MYASEEKTLRANVWINKKVGVYSTPTFFITISN